MGNKKDLPVVLITVKPTYERPVRTNIYVPEAAYDRIDDAVPNAIVLASNGVTYVVEEEADKFLQENKSDAQFIVDNLVPDDMKVNIGGKSLVHSSGLVGVLDRAAQEHTNLKKRALKQYARDTLTNISDSDQAQTLRRDRDHFLKNEQKKLRSLRNSDLDEVTGEPLKPGYEFHHSNQKSIFTDPALGIDPEKGKLVNKDTHQEIHRKKIRTADELDAFIQEKAKKPST